MIKFIFRRWPNEAENPRRRHQTDEQVDQEGAQLGQDPPARVQGRGQARGVLLPLPSPVQKQENLQRGK